MTRERSISAVLFDLDGTLVDSRADLVSAVNHALELAGRPGQTEAQITPHIGNGMVRLVSGVFGAVPEEVLAAGVAAFAAYYDEHCLDSTRLYDDVKDGLEALAPRAKLAVVTNKPAAFTERILRGLGIRNHISSVVGGDSLPERKPHPAPLLKALNDLNASPLHALMVGDGMQDLLAGGAAGVRTCLARYGYGTSNDAAALSPTYTIDAFRDIKEIVL